MCAHLGVSGSRVLGWLLSCGLSEDAQSESNRAINNYIDENLEAPLGCYHFFACDIGFGHTPVCLQLAVPRDVCEE